MTKRIFCGVMLWAWAISAVAAEAGGSVAVVYNQNLPESKKIAEHYAARRGVPTNQIFGVDVSATAETMSRPEFQDKLQNPLFDWLVKEKLFTRNPKKKTATDTQYQPIVESKIRYIVLCYGIPWKIARDTMLKEAGLEGIQEPLRPRNEAAVDADLALLPVSQEKSLPLTGPVISPFYLVTNAAAFNPASGIIMVTRLDGPSAEIARGLVDKALQAESDGLWGHAYIDARGITNGEYKTGDDWMHGAAEVTHRLGFETFLDDKDPTFSSSYPMSQIAFYCGWYDQNVSGPFTRTAVEFMPGAFAYHLHSYSASQLRSTTQNWVGPLLAKGATISMGSVDEPYLTGTPNVAVFLDRLIFRRWTFGEAAYACQGALSWQTTVVGDPLYRPFGQPPDALHFKLEHEKSPLLEWSHLRVVNLNQASGAGVNDLIKYIDSIRAVRTNSAVIQEKLGQLLESDKRLTAACEAYEKAVHLKPSPQQKVRLLLRLGELQTRLGRDDEASNAYEQLVTEVPDYPDAPNVYRHLAGLARKLGKIDQAVIFDRQGQRTNTPTLK